MQEKLKPGLSVTLTFDVLSPFLAMKTSIYDVRGSRIIISQTSPPILPSHVGEVASVTFIIRNKGQRVTRYGFSASVVKLIPDYEIYSSQKVPAVMLQQRSDVKEINRRLMYRISPTRSSKIKIMLGNETVDIVDISLGGAKIRHAMGHALEPNEDIKLTFIIDYRRFTVPSRIIRVDQERGSTNGHAGQLVSVQFDSKEQEFGRMLSMNILMMERQLLANSKH